ncbi:MAG: hypothetical protein ACRD40_13560 [Candidatus Acidiferrales bacterium]
MIWHIFKKDFRLLWPFVAAMAAVWWIEMFINFHLGLFGESDLLITLTQVLLIAGVFGTMFLVVAIVHLDPVPGIRQDWLVRPIPRGKLLVEKFLFALVLVIAPVFGANVFQGVANGFAVSAVLGAAAAAAAIFACLFVLPFFALGAVTEKMTAAFIFGSICTAAGSVLMATINEMNSSANGTIVTAARGGIAWIPLTLEFVLVALGAGVVLWLQYFHRRTAEGYFAISVFGILFIAAQLLPWAPAFAIEKHFSAQPVAAGAVQLSFDSGLGKFKSPSGVVHSLQKFQPNGGDQTADVFLPLQSSGIPNDSILLSDWVDFHLSSQGREVYHGIGENLEIDPSSANSSGKSPYQEVELPMSFYAGAKERAVAVRTDYSLTLFKLANSYSVPALSGSERMPGLGRCETQINEAETAVELRCMQLTKAPICATVFLENTSTGAQNPPRSICNSAYGLSRNLISYASDVTAHYGGNVPFRDATGLAKYPVDGSQLSDSRVVIRVYEPVDHFTRTLAIPNIRLGDWEAQ